MKVYLYKMYRRTPELYRCGLSEYWRREIGAGRPSAFARRIGGCEVKKSVLNGASKSVR